MPQLRPDVAKKVNIKKKANGIIPLKRQPGESSFVMYMYVLLCIVSL